MQHTELDHLVIAATDLDEAAAWCARTLGQEPEPGGCHPTMGTHNRLLALAPAADGAPRYLELIAIDPAAPSPDRPRWFGLDDPGLQARLRREGPVLVGYVVRSTMIDMHRWGLIHARFQPGPILQAHRDTPAGRLSWQIVVAEDGQPLAGGAVPTLIQWQGPHPCERLPPGVVALERLTVRGMPDLAAQVLRLRGLQREPFPGPAVEAELRRPDGSIVRLVGGR